MSTNLPITVIIPTMDRPQTLERTMKSYASAAFIPEQIILVDQSRTEQNRLRTKVLADSFGAEYLYRSIPSLTAARNAGLSMADHEIVVCSDDDIDVYDHTLKNVYELMEGGQVALIAGLDDNAPKHSSPIGYLLGTKSFKKRHIGYVTKSMLGRYPDSVVGTIDTEWAMGYFFVVRKSCLNRWNIRWDERLISYAYAEDLDFSWRYCDKAHKEGFKCILTDMVKVKHMVSQEYRVPTKKSTYMYAIHRRYIAHKLGCGSKLAMAWCDFWRIVERTIKRQNVRDLIDAIKLASVLERSGFGGMEDSISHIQKN